MLIQADPTPQLHVMSPHLLVSTTRELAHHLAIPGFQLSVSGVAQTMVEAGSSIALTLVPTSSVHDMAINRVSARGHRLLCLRGTSAE